MAGFLLDDAIGWLARVALSAITALWTLLSQTAFSTPDVTSLPQVHLITGRSLAVVNVGFVLAVMATGIVVMTNQNLQVRYGVSEVVPRLVIGFVAANFAVPLCRQLVVAANALTSALTGGGVSSTDAFGQLLQVIKEAMADPANALLAAVIGLLIAALTAMLLAGWLVRLGVLVVLVGVAPLGLACHATPFTDGAARLWWRSMIATLGTVVLQALALQTTLVIFLDPAANVAALHLPRDPSRTFNLLVVACLLWVVIKIPALMRRYVTRGGGHNVAGLLVRMVVVSQLSSLLRLPGRARAAGRRPVMRASSERPSVANTVIPYWRPRKPGPTPTRPTPATRTSAPTPGGGGQSSGRPIVPPGVTPATAMPKTRPAWQRPPTRPRPPLPGADPGGSGPQRGT